MESESLLWHIGYLCAHTFIKVVLFFMGPLRVRNKSRIPKEGGLIIVANHISDIDPPTIQIACPRHISFMAKSTLYDNFLLAGILNYFRAFPVRSGQPDRKAFRQATEILGKGKVIALFPEGQISEDGKLLPIMPGIALLARLANVPIICCGVVNTDRVIPYKRVFPRPAFCSIWVNFGEPRHFGPKVSTEEVVSWIESQLRALTGQN